MTPSILLGTTLSNAGQWILQVTLSWLVYDLTASGTMLIPTTVAPARRRSSDSARVSYAGPETAAYTPSVTLEGSAA